MMRRIVLGKTGIEINRLGFGGIPIQRVDEREAVETVIHAIERARTCTECGECVDRCPYNLPIPELIRENIAWIDGRFR